MITRTEYLTYIETLLEPNQFQDYCPNGLQVAGTDQINVVVTGVTASYALLEAAVELKADAVLVHHGYFWRGEDPRIIGMKQRRLKFLLDHNINLIAYHLPLDAHSELGNNAQLAQMLGINPTGMILGTGQPALAMAGELSESTTLASLSQKIERCLQRKPTVIEGHDRPIKTIGWCSGGAQHYIEQAAAQGMDAYLSGEISEQTTHLARELGIHYIAAGHHATERYGVKALGEHLAKQFKLQHHFIEIDNPV